jgi:flagellum-specific peptidoglycan hydrolase FlgJ
MKDSFIGYANFLTKNKRYKEAFNYWSDINPKPEYYGSNYQWYDSDKFAYEIAKAWYATDPNYYQKIVSISRKLDSNIA